MSSRGGHYFYNYKEDLSSVSSSKDDVRNAPAGSITANSSPKTICKDVYLKRKRDSKRCWSEDQKTVRGNIGLLNLWWKRKCFKPDAESGKRIAKSKVRRKKVPDSGSG